MHTVRLPVVMIVTGTMAMAAMLPLRAVGKAMMMASKGRRPHHFWCIGGSGR